MNTITCSLAPHIATMPEWRVELGHSLAGMRDAMADFDRFRASQHPGERVLSRDLATAWCQDTTTGTWGAHRSPFREYTIPVIFRLIPGAGLRPPEARLLRRHDIDPDNAAHPARRTPAARPRDPGRPRE